MAREKKLDEPREPNTVPDAPAPNACPCVRALTALQQHEHDDQQCDQRVPDEHDLLRI